jgi:hypothetical protein
MSRLLGSVGDGGKNVPSDVKAVQYLLSVRGMNPGVIDSICGKKTIAAIERFQYGFMSHPDGVVDVDGNTWRRLAGQTAAPVVRTASTSGPSATPKPPRIPTVPRPSLVPPVSGSAKPIVSVDNKGLKGLIAVPPKSSFNIGLVPVNNAYMIKTLGKPRPEGGYGKNDSVITNPKLRDAMTTKDVGPFKVTGLAPAVASLANVMAEIKQQHFDVYSALTYGGMKVCRLQRNSPTAISNHSWGTAIDLGIGKRDGFADVDVRGDKKTYIGLARIAPIFNKHGWYWGAAFGTEDAMHFEGSKALIDQWARSLV